MGENGSRVEERREKINEVLNIIDFKTINSRSKYEV